MDRILLRGGLLLTQNAQSEEFRGDILIEEGVIVDVGKHFEADAEVLDARKFAILPGFIDTHRHTWQTALRGMAAGETLAGYQRKIQGRFGALFEPDDVYAGNLLGAMSAGQGGITTLCDESHVQNSPAHTDAAVAALKASGIRAVFDYGWPSIDAELWLRDSKFDHPDYVRDLQREQFPDGRSELVTLQMMLRGPLMTSIEITARDVAFARELGLRSVMHVVGGSIAALHKAGLLGDDMTFIHCCDSSDEELSMVRQSGASISSSPNLELNMLGLGAPPLRRFVAAGIRPSLSIDVETSVSGDMFSTMRAALLSQTAEDLYQPSSSELPVFTPRDVLRFATINGAVACGLDKMTGSIEIGKKADLILIDLNSHNLAPVDDNHAPDVIVASAHPGNVDSVIVEGRFIRRGGKAIEQDAIDRAVTLARSSRERLQSAAA